MYCSLSLRLVVAFVWLTGCEGNTTPSVTDVRLSPSPAMVNDTLVCAYSFVDPDGDPDESRLQWMINGELNSEKTSSLSDGFLASDLVECWVTPDDGLVEGTPVSASLVIENTPAVVSEVVISPAEAFADSELRCNYAFSDADGDGDSSAVSWEVNGLETGLAEATLSGVFSGSDSVTCSVTPLDGIPERSPAVIIGNTAPFVSDILIQPNDAKASDTLICSYVFNDIDVKDSDNSTITWTLNGAILAGQTSSSLSAGFVVGDVVGCTVSSSDGQVAGNVLSTEITIGNTLAVVGNLSLTPLPIYAGQELTCAYVFSDLDGQVDNSSISWEVDAVLQNETSAIFSEFVGGQLIRCEVQANDGLDDGNSLAVSATVDNSDPVVSNVVISPGPAFYGTDLSCAYDWFDVDGNADNSTIAWTVNGGLVGTGATLTDDVFLAGDTVACEVTPDDGISGSQASILASIVISNSAPVVSAVSLSPLSPVVSDTLLCTYSFYDADNELDQSSIAWTNQAGTLLGTGSSLVGVFARDDLISCSVTAFDGLLSGNSASMSVVIENTSPSLNGCTIGPSNPGTTAEIEVLSLDGWSDDDAADSIAAAQYSWWVNGVVDASVSGGTYPSSSTQAGDSLSVSCTPDDGVHQGNPVTSNTLVVENTPPSISDCSLSSTSPTTSDPLQAMLVGWEDPDNQTAAGEYAWYVNGVEVNGATSSTLDASNYFKGDAVYVVCVPDDGGAVGLAVTSQVATVVNSPPSITGCSLVSTSPTTVDDLLATYSGWSDPDLVDSQSVQIGWVKNGVVDVAQTASSYPSIETVKGDVLYASCSAWDGEDVGNTVDSMLATVINSMPTVSSVVITPIGNGGAGELHCSYQFDDHDNGVDNSIIEWSTGAVSLGSGPTLTLGYLVGETVSCVVTAQDDEAIGNQAFASLLIEPVCTGVDLDGSLLACVNVESSTKQPIHERLGGFNVNLNFHGLSIWDDRLIEKARTTTAGHFRYPAGFGYSGSWRVGNVVRDWALRFEPDPNCDTNTDCVAPETCEPQATPAKPNHKQCQQVCDDSDPLDVDKDCSGTDLCIFGQCTTSCYDVVNGPDENLCAPPTNPGDPPEPNPYACYRREGTNYGCVGDKVTKYLDYESTIKGKGYYLPGDLIRFSELVGAKVAIHVNVMTDDSASAGDFAREIIDRGVDVAVWALGIEVFYFRSTDPPPTFWRSGYDYMEDLEPYIQEIKDAYANAGLSPPPISISFSDHENSWQSVWDWGKDGLIDPNGDGTFGSDNRPGIGDYVLENGRSFTASDFHWYPGAASTPLLDSGLDAIDIINDDLPNKVTQYIDDYFLPLSCADEGGVCSDPNEPEIFITEYNIQTTWASTLAAVHASEYLLRNSVHPRVALMGFHSLTSGCLDTLQLHRDEAGDAGYFNYFGSFDSNAKLTDGSHAVNFDSFTTISCLALELVQTAVNTSSYGYETSTEVGSVAVEEDQRIYSQALEGEEHDYLIITNRSDTPHRLTPIWDGTYIERPGVIRLLDGIAPEKRNCLNGQANLDPDEVCADLTLSPDTPWDPADPVDVPAWSVVRLSLPRMPAALAAPIGLSVLAGQREATISWSAVGGADSYEVRYNVNPLSMNSDGYHPIRVSLDASACGSTCSLVLSNLAHDVEHELTLAALDATGRGASATPVTFTPTRRELSTGAWAVGVGGATWTQVGGVISANYSGGPPSYLAMADADPALPNPDWSDTSFSAEFRLSCSCAPGAANTNPCGRVGMATRYVSDTDHIKAYLEYDEDDGCYFRISSMAGGVLSRSSNIGGPIVNGQGGVALDNSGAPKYPEIPAIDDGQWHTMQLSAEEQVVRFWLDGRLIAAAQNTDGVSGTVALTTRQQEMEWRDISVWAAPW